MPPGVNALLCPFPTANDCRIDIKSTTAILIYILTIQSSERYMSRSAAYNGSTCQRMDGYKHSNGYCYFTPTAAMQSCSTYYTNCQCYSYWSTSYTNATCININGAYFDGHCYYNSASCYYYWKGGQCYNRRHYYYSTYSCLSGAVRYGSYCYYNVF